MAALTVYPTGTAATTVSTANTLTTTAPGSETSKTSKTGKSTAWGVLWSQSNSSAWAAAASEPAFGDVHGFILDDTSLEGLTIAAGTWTCKAKVSTSSGTVTGVVHVRCGVRHSNGTYSEIVNCAAASTGFTSTAAVVTATGSGSATTLATGDKLYVQVELQITANSSSSTTATTSLFENLSTNESIVTPGTFSVVTGSANLNATAALHAAGTQTAKTGSSLHATATLTAAGTQTARTGAHLSATSSITAAGVRATFGAASLHGTASFTSTGSHTAATGAALHATTTFTAAGTVTGSAPSTYNDGASLTASATLHAAGVRTTYGAASLQATTHLTAAGYQTSHTGATLAAQASLTVTTTSQSTTDTPIESFAYKTWVYRRDTIVDHTDECVTAHPELFTQAGGTKTSTTSFVYYDQTLKRHRAVWPGDKVAATDNAYLAAPNNFT